MDQNVEACEDIERKLHDYIFRSHNLAMDYVSKKSLREAGRILRACEQFFKNDLPESAKLISRKKGLLHTVYNNLAQHSNIQADMESSIDFLKQALEVADDVVTEKSLLPLAETFLNLGNGCSYLNRY